MAPRSIIAATSPSYLCGDQPSIVRFQGETFKELKQRLISAHLPGVSEDSYIEIKIDEDTFVCLLDDDVLPSGDVHVSIHNDPSGLGWQKPASWECGLDFGGLPHDNPFAMEFGPSPPMHRKGHHGHGPHPHCHHEEEYVHVVEDDLKENCTSDGSGRHETHERPDGEADWKHCHRGNRRSRSHSRCRFKGRSRSPKYRGGHHGHHMMKHVTHVHHHHHHGMRFRGCGAHGRQAMRGPPPPHFFTRGRHFRGRHNEQPGFGGPQQPEAPGPSREVTAEFGALTVGDSTAAGH